MEQKLLRQLQETELDILIKLDSFCSEHGIKYSLYAGTAIGAVRHKGFIPWDDDIDVVMTRCNYNRFIKIIKTNPIAGFVVDSPELNTECCISHAKLIKNGTVFLTENDDENTGNHGIWVDIFPLDKITSKNSKKIYSLGRKIILFTRARNKIKHDKLHKKIMRMIVSSVPTKTSNKCIKKYLRELEINDKELQSNYRWTELAATYTFKYSFDASMMDNLHRTEFEGHDFLIVDDYDAMLSQLYGDYMRLPPVSDRICKHNPVKIVFNNH